MRLRFFFHPISFSFGPLSHFRYPPNQEIILTLWKDLEKIHDEIDSTSPITLVMNGKTLFSGTKLGDYKIGERRKNGPKWPHPYAGNQVPAHKLLA
jgi:hypothetical protein